MNSIQELNIALLAAFRVDSFERLVRYGIDARLDEIVSPSAPLAKVIFDTIDWAVRNGRINRLVDAAKQHSQNPLIQSLEWPKVECSEGRRVSMDQQTVLEILLLRIKNIENIVDRLERFHVLLFFAVIVILSLSIAGLLGLY